MLVLLLRVFYFAFFAVTLLLEGLTGMRQFSHWASQDFDQNWMLKYLNKPQTTAFINDQEILSDSVIILIKLYLLSLVLTLEINNNTSFLKLHW